MRPIIGPVRRKPSITNISPAKKRESFRGRRFPPGDELLHFADNKLPPQWLKHAMARQYYTVDM